MESICDSLNNAISKKLVKSVCPKVRACMHTIIFLFCLCTARLTLFCWTHTRPFRVSPEFQLSFPRTWQPENSHKDSHYQLRLKCQEFETPQTQIACTMRWHSGVQRTTASFHVVSVLCSDTSIVSWVPVTALIRQTGKATD